ncbi:MAG: preprotein translocase subunit SecG [Sedimentisphaerales bacterium]|nr:preprotein translocase subunit SecG [Sedimentisphaerales bacterium]
MNLVAVLFTLVAVVLILLVLIQKGRGGGLSAAFGGGMASGLLGSKTGDFLTWATIIVVSVFLVLAVVLARFYRPNVSEYGGAATSTSQPVTKGTPVQPSGATSQPAPQEPAPAPAEQPSGMDAGATAPQTEPPATPPAGGATTPAPETGATGG